MSEAAKPEVLFVLGGPGAGKGTQCARIVENYKTWAHVSAGDCLRAERNDPSSKDGEMINNIIKEGKLVPSAITVKLLLKAMAKAKDDGKTCFLVDGFPRGIENLNTWKSEAGDAATVCGILFYDAKEEELEKRLLARGETSGRVDDNLESIRKRFKTYMEETMPIVEKFKSEGRVFTIDGMPPEDDVWKITKARVEEVEEFGGKQVMRLSQKNSTGFYIRAATTFLKGAEGKEPVKELVVSALGNSINAAVTVATIMERDGLATIASVRTAYPEMQNGRVGRGCAQIVIDLVKKD
mmetsp:Transcript_58579/g.117245  ORF Transcript_58579/g.117245 Transcript_58579/m.117245 type:complete len:296 (-) Transcript_58579:110-997(-)